MCSKALLEVTSINCQEKLLILVIIFDAWIVIVTSFKFQNDVVLGRIKFI